MAIQRDCPGANERNHDGLFAQWGKYRPRGRSPPPFFCALFVAVVAVAPHSAEAGDGPMPWSKHPALSLPIPMTVVGSTFLPAGTAAEYFQALTALGFECTAEDNTRQRMRRVRVVCWDASTTLLYEGGFPVGYGAVIFDRVQRDGALLGGGALLAHVRAVAPGAGEATRR